VLSPFKKGEFAGASLYSFLTLEFEMSDAAVTSPLALGAIRKGRPPKSDSMNSAERAQRAREKRKEAGLSEVKCYLDESARANLVALCGIHNCTISEAIAMALGAAVCNGLTIH
jgi:hypothetical protein